MFYFEVRGAYMSVMKACSECANEGHYALPHDALLRLMGKVQAVLVADRGCPLTGSVLVATLFRASGPVADAVNVILGEPRISTLVQVANHLVASAPPSGAPHPKGVVGGGGGGG